MGKQNTLHSIHVQRNDTAENWNTANPVLLKGEMGVETDTRKFKFGDGVKHWQELDYADKTLDEAIKAEASRATQRENAIEAAYKAADTAEQSRAKEAEQGLSGRIDAAVADIGKIQNIIKDGASLDDAKEALAELGDNYKDLFTVAQTLKTFLDDSDAHETAINRWQELEAFLSGITDSQTLSGLLEEMKTTLETAYKAADSALDERLKAAEKSISDSKASFDSDVNEIIDGRFTDDVYILLGGDANGHSVSD